MSVLIKGMDMPHDCFECPFSIPPVSDDSPFWMCGGNGMKVHEANTEEHRPYGCPLVEVSEDAVSPCEVCPLVKEDEKPTRYCDRNICASNEVNGISCDECVVGKEKK